MTMAEKQEALIQRLSMKLGVSAETVATIVKDTTATNVETRRQLSGLEWSYDCTTAPAMWGSMSSLDGLTSYATCSTGKQQSPIDIPAAQYGYYKTGSKKMPLGKIVTTVSKMTYSVTMSHGAPKYTCNVPNQCGYAIYNNLQYYLVQMHFHAPSEHTLNGVAYGMAVHLVHQNPTTLQYLVVGIVFDGSAATASPATKMLDSMWAYMSSSAWTSLAPYYTNVDTSVFVNATSGSYNYAGSFTTPPCTEGVQWIVQATKVPAFQKQIDDFWAFIGGYPGNARPVQPLGPYSKKNPRKFMFNVDPE
jgi:carbonic anhydrase